MTLFISLLMVCVMVALSEVSSEKGTIESVNENFVSLSCDDVHMKNRSLPSGAYYIFDGKGGKSLVYCYFEEIPGCGVGPWSLLMKLDGNKRTFSYNSYKWRSQLTYQPEMAVNGFDNTETKSIAFSRTSITKLCLGMKRHNDSKINWVGLDQIASSMYAIFNYGSYQVTNLGRDKWKSLIRNSSLQPNCNKEGFNVYHYGAKVRIGIISNQENDCNSPDSRLGFGGGGRHCGQDDYNSIGNEATCESDNGDKHIKTFGYILSKDESINNKIAAFTVDEMMWIYLDGKMTAFINDTKHVGKQVKIPISTKVLAIHARKTREIGGGILGSTSYGEKTSSYWRCSETAEDGWTTDSFDDTHWPFAKEYGKNTYAPWPYPRFVSNIERDAKWIWTEQRKTSRDIYCRAVLQGDLGCPFGWKYYHGSCYFIGKDRCQSFTNAREKCRKANSKLVSLHSQGQNNFLHYAFGSSRFWIGLHDTAKEGVFNWTDNSPLDYTNWGAGEPNDASSEDCVELTSTSKWNDLRCSTCLSYACKIVLHGCQVRNGDCSHLCVNTSDTYKCACPYPGQQLGKDEHTCEVTGLDVQITNDSLRLTIPESTESSTSFDIHFRDPACKAVKRGSMYVLETPLDACGTTSVETYDATVYSNSISMKSKDLKRSIKKASQYVSVPFFCFVSENGTNCVIPYQSHLGPMSYTDTNYGVYSVGMTLYDSKRFDVAYRHNDYPVAAKVYGNLVYFELQIISPNSKLTVIPNTCYTSPSQEFESPRKYFFIEDGCFTDNTVTYHKSTPDTKRLSVRVNHFSLESPYVYIHCNVHVCFARDKNSRCAKGCLSHTTQSVTGDKGIGKTLSAGPIIFTTKTKRLKRPKQPKNPKKNKTSPKARKANRSDSSTLGVSYANFIILALLCLIVLVAGIFLVKKYRKRQQAKPGTYFNLSDKYADASL